MCNLRPNGGLSMMPNYKGHSCRYDPGTRTYSRSSVKVNFPCSSCGSERPQEWVQGSSGGWKLEIGVCCEPRS